MDTNQASEAAEGRQDQYRLLVESIVGYVIYMLDLQGYVTSWNRGAYRAPRRTAC